MQVKSTQLTNIAIENSNCFLSTLKAYSVHLKRLVIQRTLKRPHQVRLAVLFCRLRMKLPLDLNY